MKKTPLIVKIIFCLVVFILCSVLAVYLSGAILMIVHKRVPDFNALTWYQNWYNLAGADHAFDKKLYGSLLAAVIISYGAPIAMYFAAAVQRPLHGAARFARISEIQKAGLLNTEKGILVGKLGSKYLVFPGQQFAILAAPTRSGKGVSAAIPNLLNWPDSAVCLDIKQTNFQKTAGYRKNCGQDVYLWNPFAENGKTHRCNILSYIRPDFAISDANKIGYIFWPQTGDAKEDFFNDQARNLFLAVVLYLLETPGLPRTMGEVLRQGSGLGGPLVDHFKALIADREAKGKPLSQPCNLAFNRFFSNAKSDNTLGGIISSFTGPLTTWSNPLVDAATSADDFDLRDLRKKRMTIYVGITPDYLPEAGRLLNAFFSVLLNMNTKETPEQNPELKYQCLLLLDEFTAMGRVNILATSAAYIAEYGLRVFTIIQSLSQLDGRYGKEDSRTYITNHALQIIFAPREQRDANEASEMLGYLTQRAKSRGISRSSGTKSTTSSSSENISDQRRALLLPQEVKEIGQDKEIIALENTKPILCEKIRYFDDPVFMARLLPAPDVPVLDMDLYHATVEKRIREATPEDVTGEINMQKLVASSSVDNISEPVNVAEAQAFADKLWSGFVASEGNEVSGGVLNDSEGSDAPAEAAEIECELIDMTVLDKVS
jgi:type IV secretion system protein VirD4